MDDIKRARLEVFIEQTKQGVLLVVGSRFDAIKAQLLPDAPAEVDCGTPETRPPSVHILKCWPRYFCELVAGTKTAEVRNNDRDFRAGDYLLLREYDQNAAGFTARWLVAKVRGVTDLDAVLMTGHVLLSLAFGVWGDGHRLDAHPLEDEELRRDRWYRQCVEAEEKWSWWLVRDRQPSREQRMSRTYHPEVARSESQGDERDPKTWTKPSVVRDMLAEPYPSDPTALPDAAARRVPVSQPDGHAEDAALERDWPGRRIVHATRGPAS
jgi:hypothetical protein